MKLPSSYSSHIFVPVHAFDQDTSELYKPTTDTVNVVNPTLATLAYKQILPTNITQVSLTKLILSAIIPMHTTPGSAGFAIKNTHNLKLLPHSVTMVHMGLACNIPDAQLYMHITPRNSLSLKHIIVEVVWYIAITAVKYLFF